MAMTRKNLFFDEKTHKRLRALATVGQNTMSGVLRDLINAEFDRQTAEARLKPRVEATGAPYSADREGGLG